jgi:hypothetical protein
MNRRSANHECTAAPALAPESLRARLDFPDERLLAECEVHLHRTGGPGGQHRNKVSSAVRLRHLPSGLVVTASERRSQHENKANALQRLREGLAVSVRAPPPVEIVWPASVQIRDGRLRVGEQNPALWHIVALVLDELAACDGQVQKAAARLGVSTSSLTRFLAEHPKAWTEANRIRQAAGLAALRA